MLNGKKSYLAALGFVLLGLFKLTQGESLEEAITFMLAGGSVVGLRHALPAKTGTLDLTKLRCAVGAVLLAVLLCAGCTVPQGGPGSSVSLSYDTGTKAVSVAVTPAK